MVVVDAPKSIPPTTALLTHHIHTGSMVMPNTSPSQIRLSRRALFGAGLSGATLLALSACTPAPRFVSPTSAAVTGAEGLRPQTGTIVKHALRAAEETIDLAGEQVRTWAYGPTLAPVIRAQRGDTIQAALTNALSEETTVHWHGVALRNDMDGVPYLTQDPIAAGKNFTYQFTAPHPGTYWFHPHVGTQLDRGLYGALIIDDPKEPLAYDEEWVVVLDDWLDGVTATPPEVFQELSRGMKAMAGMGDMPMRSGNMLMGAKSDALGGDAGEVYYPHYLVNGRPPADPETFTSRPGNRVRIRLINAGGDTAFRVAVGSHPMTITHTDGFPVSPTEVDSVLIGMGERYDVLVTLADGVFPFVAEAEGKQARAFAIVRTGSGATPPPDIPVAELTGRIGAVDELTAVDSVSLSRRRPDQELTVRLTGGMGSYDWALDRKSFDMKKPMADASVMNSGERIRLNFVNTTTMWHPMHLHGHTFQHVNGGPRKDTSIVLPNRTLSVEFDADNPGRWLMHCHNIYHGEAGMMGAIAYAV